jgi:hypothetical protein
MLNHMKIGDVAFGIPNKSGAGSLRYLVKVQCKESRCTPMAVIDERRGDGCLNSAIIRLFVRPKFAAGINRTRSGLRII